MHKSIKYGMLAAVFIALLLASASAEAFINRKIIESKFVPSSDDALDHPIFLRIFKKEAVLEIWIGDKNGVYTHFKDYPICYYSGTLGPKTKEGDRQSPEGFYSVTASALNPYSKYYLSFNLGYPNAYDQANGYTGDYLMVHGECVSIGCYAMTNPQIKEIYRFVEAALAKEQTKIEVHIFPFRMTEENMRAYEQNKWHSFWQILKPAYDYFEKEKRVPKITVNNKMYIINQDTR